MSDDILDEFDLPDVGMRFTPKLTPAQRKKIRESRAPVSDLARQYRISQSLVYRIRRAMVADDAPL